MWITEDGMGKLRYPFLGDKAVNIATLEVEVALQERDVGVSPEPSGVDRGSATAPGASFGMLTHPAHRQGQEAHQGKTGLQGLHSSSYLNRARRQMILMAHDVLGGGRNGSRGNLGASPGGALAASCRTANETRTRGLCPAGDEHRDGGRGSPYRDLRPDPGPVGQVPVGS